MMPAPESALPVDPEVLQMLDELQEPGEPDLLRELVTLFLRDTPERLEALAMGLASGDLDSAARAAHSVKGSAANLGAMDLHTLASSAEQEARAGRAQAVEALQVQLAHEFGRVQAQLDALLTTRPH